VQDHQKCGGGESIQSSRKGLNTLVKSAVLQKGTKLVQPFGN
jgi:hypothetical protein